jgi:hypothetical protein
MMASGESYDLRLPTNKMDVFITNKYPILNECVQVLLNVDMPVKTTYTPQHSKKK